MEKATRDDETGKRVFLVGIRDEKTGRAEADSLLKELSRLVDTLGLEIASMETVNVRENHAKYGIGTGKAAELAQKAAELEVDCLIFNRDISPSQQRNWEELAGIPAIDRQELIIQIFASRARTKEAELQVNLAQLVYALPRLQHKYIDLSRQRGGRYGTRGAGETRLETDRRLVERRIHRLKKELEVIKLRRQVQRKQRERQGIPVCVLVGYTNAGKSSILNMMMRSFGSSEQGVLAEDKLFATLDSTSRRLRLPETVSSNGTFSSIGTEIILVDTVGFIRRLPHSLLNAFRSTLEEVNRADLILNVVDAADPDAVTQYETTLAVLRELDAEGIPMLTVLNKIDKTESADILSAEALLKLFPESLPVSALKGRGLPELCMRIENSLKLRTMS